MADRIYISKTSYMAALVLSFFASGMIFTTFLAIYTQSEGIWENWTIIPFAPVLGLFTFCVFGIWFGIPTLIIGWILGVLLIRRNDLNSWHWLIMGLAAGGATAALAPVFFEMSSNDVIFFWIAYGFTSPLAAIICCKLLQRKIKKLMLPDETLLTPYC